MQLSDDDLRYLDCLRTFKVVPDSVSASETSKSAVIAVTRAVRVPTNRGASKVDSAARSCHWDEKCADHFGPPRSSPSKIHQKEEDHGRSIEYAPARKLPFCSSRTMSEPDVLIQGTTLSNLCPMGRICRVLGVWYRLK